MAIFMWIAQVLGVMFILMTVYFKGKKDGAIVTYDNLDFIENVHESCLKTIRTKKEELKEE